MKELLATTKIKRSPIYLYSLSGKNEIIRTERKHKTNKEVIGYVDNIEREKGYIYYISTDKNGFLEIRRAKKDCIPKAVKKMNWLEVIKD